MSTETIADRIRMLLAERGWSGRELAQKAGFRTPSQVHNILKRLDRDPAAIEVATVEKIARGAGVSPHWLQYGGTRDAEPQSRVIPEPQPRVPAEDETVLETAVFDVASRANVDEPGRYTIADLDATRAAVRETGRWIQSGADLAAMARQWLDAARQLRIEGERATTVAIATRVAVGKLPTAQQAAADRTAALNALAAEAARAHGFEPGSGAPALKEALRARGLIPKEEVPAPPPPPPVAPGSRKPKRGGKG